MLQQSVKVNTIDRDNTISIDYLTKTVKTNESFSEAYENKE